jgi:putative addiction module component (TIGR02574 family)
MTRTHVTSAALKLPHRDRAELAARLLRSLEELPEGEWEAVWAAEAERRLTEVRSGRMKESPAKDVFARVRKARR